MIIQLHDMKLMQFRCGRKFYKFYPTETNVKQDCVLDLTLLSISFSMMLKKFTKEMDDRFNMYICMHKNGILFNLKYLYSW